MVCSVKPHPISHTVTWWHYFINFVKYSAIQINKILISGLMYHATMRIRLTTQKATLLCGGIYFLSYP